MLQNITAEDIYKTFLVEVSKTENLYNDNHNKEISFPMGYVKNFNHSNNFPSMTTSAISGRDNKIHAKFFTRTMVLYKIMNQFGINKIGNFIGNMQAYFSLFGQSNETTEALSKLMSMEENKTNLLLISKLFSLNDFIAVTDDPILTLYQPFQTCFEYMVNLYTSVEGKFTHSSPCMNLKDNLECKDFCDWHKDIINNQLKKQELLTLMR